MTTTSPACTRLFAVECIACTQTRPATSTPASPTCSSPSRTSTIEPTGVGTSRRDASRDSRM
jgi:hypothetical protein